MSYRARALKTETYVTIFVRVSGLPGFDIGSIPVGIVLRKEVIQPQVPLRLPCYDFTPVTNHSLGACLPCGLAQPLLKQTTPMV